MEFRKCLDCSEYKYISQKGVCESCIDNSWAVRCAIPRLTPFCVEKGISKKEAKELEDMSPYFTKIHMREIN